MSIILQEAGWMRTAYKLAKRFGGKVVTAGRSKHPKIVGLDASGKQIKMTIPSSPSDNARTAKNVEAQLRRAGFIDQSKAAKVKDALVKGSKETVLKPATKSTPPVGRSASTVSKQTTFKDFTQKYQPNVQGPSKPNRKPRVRVQGPESELAHRHKKAFDKMLDNVIKDVRGRKVPTAKRKKISKAELDKMNIPQREKDKLIKQGLVENKFKVAAQLMRKAGVRNYDDLTRVVNTIKQQVGDKIIQGIRTPKQPTKKGLELQKRMSRAVDKNKDKYPGLFDEQIAQEGVHPLEVIHTEHNKHRDDKLNYQYKDVTNPKRPSDPIKDLKRKGTP